MRPVDAVGVYRVPLTIRLDHGNLCSIMDNKRSVMAVLTWIKSRKLFLKIQEGTGDNLLREDRAAGYVDYVL